MEFVFAAMWLLVGIYLLYYGKKEYKVLYALGVYFIFLCVWWVANALLPLDLFSGIYVTILRIISGIALAVAIFIYVMHKRKTTEKDKN